MNFTCLSHDGVSLIKTSSIAVKTSQSDFIFRQVSKIHLYNIMYIFFVVFICLNGLIYLFFIQ